MREHHDTVVIGGGQAGLAMSTVLQQHGREHIVLERRRVGERWRTERWDSLRFQFPNWSVQLLDYAYAGDDPDGFAHYGEILRVIDDYAVSTGSPVREHTEVVGLAEDGDNGFVVTLADGSLYDASGRSLLILEVPGSPHSSKTVSILRTRKEGRIAGQRGDMLAPTTAPDPAQVVLEHLDLDLGQVMHLMRAFDAHVGDPPRSVPHAQSAPGRCATCSSGASTHPNE